MLQRRSVARFCAVRYANYSLTYRIIDRVFQARPRRGTQPRDSRVGAASRHGPPPRCRRRRGSSPPATRTRWGRPRELFRPLPGVAHMRTRMRKRVQTDRRTQTHTHTRTHTYTHAHAHTRTRTHARTHIYTHIHARTHTHKHAHTHTHTHIHTHARTHAHTRTHTRTSTRAYAAQVCGLHLVSAFGRGQDVADILRILVQGARARACVVVCVRGCFAWSMCVRACACLCVRGECLCACAPGGGLRVGALRRLCGGPRACVAAAWPPA
jgi:hypothetical protein